MPGDLIPLLSVILNHVIDLHLWDFVYTSQAT
jgi:hypothetical protein